MSDQATSSFYIDNAATYATRDRTLPVNRLDAFLSALPKGAAILELGCGGGQDSAYMLSKGFAVTATDGSEQLAKQAETLLQRPVKVMQFQELQDEDIFDGIWAEASLLHVPRTQLPDILHRIHRAAKPGGMFHATFKAGEAEGHDEFGRYYNYPSAALLSEMLGKSGWRNVVITERDGSGYDRKPTRWLIMRAQK
jgi:2-polyprenyl-3-methyl-5-hydroxy-6-metoxy-1,4-benzoquinol methylase